MIIFCEAVANLSVADLDRLGDFVQSITPRDLSPKMARKPSVRLYELCSAFHTVAKVYIEEILSASQNMLSSVGTSHATSGEGSQIRNTSTTLLHHGLLNTLEGDFTWPAEDWFLPDQYMTGIMDIGSRQSAGVP